jgi:hypothetical protein
VKSSDEEEKYKAVGADEGETWCWQRSLVHTVYMTQRFYLARN